MHCCCVPDIHGSLSASSDSQLFFERSITPQVMRTAPQRTPHKLFQISRKATRKQRQIDGERSIDSKLNMKVLDTLHVLLSGSDWGCLTSHSPPRQELQALRMEREDDHHRKLIDSIEDISDVIEESSTFARGKKLIERYPFQTGLLGTH